MNKRQIFFPAETIIEIVGNVASGKTTLSKQISLKSTCEYIDIDVYTKNPFLSLFVADEKRWAFTSDLYFSLIRSQKIPEIIKTMQFIPIITDSSLDMGIHVYSKACFLDEKMTKNEWELLQKMHEILMQKVPRIHATIFLDVPIDTLMKRIVTRGREHEQEYSRKYITQLQEQLDVYKNDMVALGSRKVIATYHQQENKLEFHTKEDKRLEKLFRIL